MRRTPFMMASTTNSVYAQGGTRSGYFLRQRALAAANRVVAGASALVSNVMDDDIDDGKPAKPSLYTEERCLVFPGFAFIKDEQLTVGLEGFAYRLRPLESASRTQKLFVSAARQLASLPSIPKAAAEEEHLDVELSPEELRQQARDYNERVKAAQTPDSSHSLRAAVGRIRPSRSNTMDSIASTSSIATANTSNSVASTVRPSGVTYSDASLEMLHQNLHARLRLFFSQKLVGRRIRVSVYLLPAAAEHTQEICVAKGLLLTEVGGVFKSSISVPWSAGDPHGRKLRVRTELLSEQVEEETIDDQHSLERVMNRSDEANVTVTYAHAPIRVISDIDDTIKATHVLGGIKAVFRNVFTRPHEELLVEGMKDWYWEMYDKGACFHFVSNSPFELFGVLREYLHAAGFPPGSVRLKEYGGSSSLLGGLWEAAGQRKRGGVEEILRTFTDSRFLLVGDSGEQDLELYASLAAQFPRQILGVFIRDVTTPLSHTTLATSQSQPGGPQQPPGPGQLKRRNSEIEQEKILAALAKEEARKAPAPGLDDADEFSPNNPLDLNTEDSGVLAPYDQEGYTEVERRVISLFRDRVLRAKREMPKGVVLKIFRTGQECRKDAEVLMQKSEKRP